MENKNLNSLQLEMQNKVDELLAQGQTHMLTLFAWDSDEGTELVVKEKAAKDKTMETLNSSVDIEEDIYIEQALETDCILTDGSASVLIPVTLKCRNMFADYTHLRLFIPKLITVDDIFNITRLDFEIAEEEEYIFAARLEGIKEECTSMSVEFYSYVNAGAALVLTQDFGGKTERDMSGYRFFRQIGADENDDFYAVFDNKNYAFRKEDNAKKLFAFG